MKNLNKYLCAGVLLIFAGSSFASENPVYSGNTATLTINAVDSETTPGIFQDVVITFARDDLWQLVTMSEGVLLPHISRVELVKTVSSPVQVFLRIHGQFPSGCGAVGEISQRLTNQKFSVLVYYKNDLWLKDPSLVACTQAIRPFTHVIPLTTYGLLAGNYEYSLNEKFNGVFTLQSDNVLSE